MEIVITMAGLGSRFTKVGYKVPKFMIEVHGKTLFEWSMESLDFFNKPNNQYIFIVRKECDAANFILKKCEEIGYRNHKIIEIDYPTDGQATTAMLASKFWNKNEELMIYNIDTYVESGQMNSEQISGDGFIPCFKAPGDHWSFVKVDRNGDATEIREKEKISDNCTLGAYYFKTCQLYENLYNEYYLDENNLEKGEKYVAPLYNFLITKGGIVRISIIDINKVHVLGTPEELEVFKSTKLK